MSNLDAQKQQRLDAWRKRVLKNHEEKKSTGNAFIPSYIGRRKDFGDQIEDPNKQQQSKK